MDMVIIATIKNIYKYIVIKYIIAYHDNLEALKEQLDSVASKLKWDDVEVVYGMTPHLHDVANFVKIAWNDISMQSLKNCFTKVDIISKFCNINDTIIEDNDFDKIVDLFQGCCKILNDADDSNLRAKIHLRFDDNDDESDFYKNVFIEYIEYAMTDDVIITAEE